MTTGTSAADDSLFCRVLEEVADRIARGESPGVEAYAQRYPQIAGKLRQTIPVAAALAEARPSPFSETQARRGEVDFSEPERLPELPGFEVLQPLGHGAMSRVYLAAQASPQRLVALKILPAVSALDERRVKRFRNEADAAALLDHPNIVPIYSVGCAANMHFIVMQYVAGGSLREWLSHLQAPDSTASRGLEEEAGDRAVEATRCGKQNETAIVGSDPSKATGLSGWLSVSVHTRAHYRLAASLCRDVARALDYAHHQGVVHRDVKPANLMLDPAGRVMVADFGLARINSGSGLTETGDVLGTLRYMSPEQACANHVLLDHRTDLYSLSATLYEMLALRPAFGAVDRPQLLHSILNDQPPSLRKIDRRIPADLETIVLRGMAKDPAERFPSARAFADDLENFLQQRPILSRRPSVLHRVSKWALRNTAIVWAMITALIVCVGSMTIGGLLVFDAYRNERQARSLAETHKLIADEANERTRTTLYISDMQNVSEAIAEGDAPRAIPLLSRHIPQPGEPDRRGFEWHYYQSLVRPPECMTLEQGDWVDDVQYSPDGRWLATTAAGGVVQIYEVGAWANVREWPTGAEDVHGLAWSGDGGRLAAACADATVLIWDVSSGEEQLRYKSHPEWANDVVFSPDGTTLFTCGVSKRAIQWDARDGTRMRDFSWHVGTITDIAISGDGRYLATASDDGRTAVWNVETGKKLMTLGVYDQPRMVAAAFSPDSRWVVSANIVGQIYMARIATKDKALVWDHAGGIEVIRFLDQTRFVAGDRSGAVYLFGVTYGKKPQDFTIKVVRHWNAHDDRAIALSTSVHSGQWASGSRDGRVQLWSRPDKFGERSHKYSKPSLGFCLASGDRCFFVGDAVREWNVRTGEFAEPFGRNKQWGRIALSADEQYLAAADEERVVVYHVSTRRLVHERPHSDQGGPDCLALSPDGRWLALGLFGLKDQPHTMWIYDLLETARPPHRMTGRTCAAFSPDGRWLATTNDDNEVLLVDLLRDFSKRVVGKHTDAVSDLEFHPHTNRLASVGSDLRLSVWDVDQMRQAYKIVAHTDRILSVTFSSDGRTIATAGTDRGIRFWHAETGQSLGSTLPWPDDFRHCRFTKDNHTLVAASRGNEEFVIYDTQP